MRIDRTALRIALATIALLIAALDLSAQIRGTVRDNAGPVVGATITTVDKRQGTVSDAEGRFSLAYKGSYPVTLSIRYLGYAERTVKVMAEKDILYVLLERTDVEGEEVDVVGKRRRENFESIDASIVANVGSVEGGIEGVLKSQMGVSSNSELSSQYRVRGGNFDENIVYVNGIEIYRPFLIRAGEQEGLSFVNPDMVSSLNFSAGGFDASYGDKMSSVLDVTYKRPTDFHAGGKISLLGAQAFAEGSVAKGRLTHITGVRYKTNQYLFGSLDTKGDYSPSFFDVQTYWTLRLPKQTSLGVLAYYASNRYDFKPSDRETTFGTISDAKKLKIYFEGKERDQYQTCVTAITADHTTTNGVRIGLAGSMFRTSEQENYDILGEYWLQQAAATQSAESVDQSANIGVGGYMEHARNDLFGEVYSLAGNAEFFFGINDTKVEVRATREHYHDYTDEWEYADSAGYVSSPSLDGITLKTALRADNSLWQTKVEAYLLNKTKRLQIGNGWLNLTSGLRIAHQNTNKATIYSPRLAINYSIRQWRFRIATGRYSQMPSLREMKRADASLNKEVKPQKSWQLIGGADLYFGSEDRPFKFTAEAYYKWMRNLNPYSIDNVRIRYEAANCAKGYAAGIDFKLNGELVKGVESWATLSIMQTKEDIEGDGHGSIPRPSDQRVQFSMLFQDYMPSNRSFGLTLSTFFGTGLPFGPSDSERWRQTSRMPGYKRVDLGISKDFAMNGDGSCKSKHIKSAVLGFDIFNLFDFANTISHFWVSDNAGHKYGVPNYLTSRRVNVSLSVKF